jgi:hypothetical protein
MRALLLLVALVTGCSSNNPQCTIGDYGAPERPEDLPAIMTAQDRCIDHWAKTYAQSKESASDVADVAAGQCAGFSQMLADLSERPDSPVAKTTPYQETAVARLDALRIVFRYRQECLR